MTTPTEFHYWNQLTPEIRLDCVKHMDFLQKLRLRASSNVGKTIVESQRFDVKEVSITDISYGIILEVNVNDEEKYKVIGEDEAIKTNQVIPLLAYLLKCGNIEKFGSKETEEFTEEIVAKLDECGPFRIKKIETGKPNRQQELYLRRCTPEILKSADFSVRGGIWDSLRPYISMESLSKVEVLDVGGLPETTSNIARMWIENNEDVGRKLKMALYDPRPSFSLFKNTFEESIVTSEEKEIRIKTDNEHKHILLRIFTPRRNLEMLDIPANFVKGSAQMFVIPANMVKGSAEYKKFFEDCVFDL